MSSGPVVVVTGASSGVGRATARAFARRGARLALVSRGSEGLDVAAEEVDALGGKGLAIPADVSEPEEVERVLQHAERVLGTVDVWVNNAMVSIVAPVWELTPAEIRRVTEVTYLGTVNGTLAALASMRPRDSGVIVQVGSALAYRGIPLQAPYCGAKHAIQGFTESLRSELLHEGSRVRITMIQLPALNTPQFEVVKTRMQREPRPVAPVFEPEVAADAIVWASEHPRREVYVGWSTTRVIVGNKLAPGIGDWYLGRKGFEAQQTERPVSAERQTNLWMPLQRDLGSSGPFAEEARPRSWQLLLTTHRRTLAGAGAALTAGVLALRALR